MPDAWYPTYSSFDSILLLANFPIVIPMDIRNNGPVPGKMSNPFAPNVERDPQYENYGGDSCHSPIGVLIARLFHPGIGIERKQETKEGYSAQG